MTAPRGGLSPLAGRSPPRAVVVGAGPAGCAAALTLARSGWAPLMLEKGAAGKDKACGDAWIAPAVDELRELGIDPQTLGPHARAFSRVEGNSGGREVWSSAFAPWQGLVARRRLVDQMLRDRVGAEGGAILFGACVTGMRKLDRQIELTVRVRRETRVFVSSAVVLASGSGCRIARAAGLDGEPELGASVSGYAPLDGAVTVPTFLFGKPSPGYAWVFPTAGREVNIGICALAKSGASALRAEMEALVERLGAGGEVASRGGLGALWSGRGTAWSDEAGVASCGDAAGLVDPISGEGLTAALVSGRRAGAAIASFLSGDGDALRRYSGWVRDWARSRYAPSLESRVLASWVGLAPAERRLFAALAG